MPGVVADKYPDVVKEIAARGHEIGFHGYFHEEFSTTTCEQENATMERCEQLIRKLTGQQMVSHRAPGGVIHDYSLRLFVERGYIASSNWRNSDGPFIHELDGVKFPGGGSQGFHLRRYAYDFYTDSAPERYELKSPGEMLEIWKEEFDTWQTSRMINFVLHPQFIGRVSRVNMLKDLIGYMLSRGAGLTQPVRGRMGFKGKRHAFKVGFPGSFKPNKNICKRGNNL